MVRLEDKVVAALPSEPVGLAIHLAALSLCLPIDLRTAITQVLLSHASIFGCIVFVPLPVTRLDERVLLPSALAASSRQQVVDRVLIPAAGC